MTYPGIKPYLSRIMFNVPGWRTRRKIVVIESDDWGSVRMPTPEVYQECLRAGYPVDKLTYERYDSLASEDDLEILFGLLSSIKDSMGNPPVFTANSLVANPDFDQMKARNFESYCHEPITETFKKYPRHARNMHLWKQGMEAKLFHPQYHGREHVNVSLLMDALRRGDEAARFGVSHGMPGCIPKGPEANGNPYVEAMRYRSREDKEAKLKIFVEGLDLFAGLFGYSSESIIPPNYTWSPDFNLAVRDHGVRFIQGLRLMAEPVPGGPSRQHSIYLGKKSKYGQRYLVRNAIFEPTLHGLGIHDPVNRCLAEMKIAFSLHKPCIITSHRINYVGFLDPKNRDRTLAMLREVLLQALRRWPEIEFMTSDQLGRTMEAEDPQTR